MLERRTTGSDPSPAQLTRYIYSNHLQSATLELNEAAEVISYEEYHPYGTTAYQANNTAINAIAKRYRYTGKERDEESGLYYHGARYYIPWLARWTASDPMESKYAGMSPYNYSFNNPVMFNDPSGADPDDPVSTPKMLDGTPITYTFKTNIYDHAGTLIGSQSRMIKDEIEGLAHGEYLTDIYLPDPGGSSRISRDIEFASGSAPTSKPFFAKSFTPYAQEQLLASQSVEKPSSTGWTSAALGFIATDIAIPEPSDAAWPKWAVYAVIAAAAGIAIALDAEEERTRPVTPPLTVPIAPPIPLTDTKPNEDNETYVYRAMETTGGNWKPSDIINGAPNGRELGARTPLSNPSSPDITPDINNMVYPSLTDPHGLSTNLVPDAVETQMARIKGEGAVGKISMSALISRGLLPTPDPKNPAHILIQPGIGMPFSAYQTILNSLPWQRYRNK